MRNAFLRLRRLLFRQPRAEDRRRVLERFLPEFGTDFEGGKRDAPPKSIGEELFEWIDFLEAVDKAVGTFRFVELGAGYGRWSVRALKAAEQRNLDDAKAVAVEAERVHGECLVRHMQANCIGATDIGSCAQPWVPLPASSTSWYLRRTRA